MGVKYGFIAVVASAVTVFAIQNNTPTNVSFLVWGLEGVSLAAVILVSLAAGMVLVGVPLSIDRWRLRSRARALEARLESAEGLRGQPGGAQPGGPPR